MLPGFAALSLAVPEPQPLSLCVVVRDTRPKQLRHTLTASEYGEFQREIGQPIGESGELVPQLGGTQGPMSRADGNGRNRVD